MEPEAAWDGNLLLQLLSETMEDVNLLEAGLGEPQKPTAQKIRDNITKAFSIARMHPQCSRQPTGASNASSDSPPRSNSNSPRSENSRKVSKEQERREMCKKRRVMAKRTKQVRILPNGEAEGMDDGHSWRKYGQKDILGSKHPRAYYRCTNRISMGCLATKQVQRSDADPSMLEITYMGEHTCHRAQKAILASSSSEPAMQQMHQDPFVSKEPNQHYQDQELLLSFQTNLKVKTKDLFAEDQPMASFSFPSTPISQLKPENHFFSSPPTLESNYVGGTHTSFTSPATSETNYYSVSPSMCSFGGVPMLQHPEPELNEIIRAATSMINGSLRFGEPEFDNNFNFDSPKFF